MSAYRLIAAGLALALSAAALPALAQAQTPPSARAIPAVEDRDYPGLILLEADITDREHRVIRVRQTIPAAPGPLTLLYPKFLPGNHAPTGPIQLLSGLTITANGERVRWTRDPVDPYAFHLDVPAGAQAVEVAFEWLTQPDGGAWRVVMTENIVNLQWDKAMLYPAGYPHSRIRVRPSVRMPDGWRYGVALDTASFQGGLAVFAPVSVETLADSPMFAGAHYNRIDLDPGGRSPVTLNIVGDRATGLQPSEAQLAAYRNLVVQADRLFGARHFDRYEFLLALTGQLGGIGLEHHRSSENTGPVDLYGAGWSRGLGSRSLLPHEFAHSWNGKHRRPADQLMPNLNVPTQNSLLWVYEGQTEYWGYVLTARSGLGTAEEVRIALAGMAAFYDHQPGREWRPLRDVTNHNLLGYRVTGPWPSWMRGSGDYYRESLLIWLDADSLIREATDDARSLDNFAQVFFGQDDGDWSVSPYTFDDVVAALNAAHPHDWAGFLNTRLDAVGPDARAPLDGLARAGWRLVYVDELTETERRIMGGWETDFQYSLGFSLSGATNRIGSILWGGRAFEADIGAGWDLVAVNDRAASPAVLRQAITEARGSTAPIRLLIRRGDVFRTVAFDYHDGLRWPRLERIPGTRDRLSEILAPRTR